MNLPPPKYRKIIPLALLPVALLLFARERASWRPQKLADLPAGHPPTISPNEKFAIVTTGSDTASLSLRDLSNGREVKRQTIKHRVLAEAFSPDGRMLAITREIRNSHDESGFSHRQGVSVLEVAGTFREFEASPNEFVFDSPVQLRFSPDGKTLWLASTDNLRSWDVASGKLTKQWFSDEGRSTSMPFTSFVDSKCRLFFRSMESGYSVWDIKSRKCLLETRLPYLADEDLEFSPDGSLATYLAQTPKGEVQMVIDTRTGKELWRPPDFPTFVGDEAIVARNKAFEVYDARSGKLLSRLQAVPGATPLASNASSWLYSLTARGELFRQRLK